MVEPGLVRYDARPRRALLPPGQGAHAGPARGAVGHLVLGRADEAGATSSRRSSRRRASSSRREHRTCRRPVGADRRALLRHHGRAHRARPRVPLHRHRGRATQSRSSTRPWQRRYWPGQDVVGKRVRLDHGMAGRDRRRGPRQQERVHRAWTRWRCCSCRGSSMRHRRATLLVHTAGASGIGGRLRSATSSTALDADMPVFGVRTMEDFYYWRATYIARLLAGSVARDGRDGRRPGRRRALWPGGLCRQPPHARDWHPHGDRRPAAGGAAHGAGLRIRAHRLRPRGRGRGQPGDGPPAASRCSTASTAPKAASTASTMTDRRALAGVGDAARDLRAGAPRRAHRPARSP